MAVRLISVIGLTMITSLVLVPTMVRAQHRLAHHDLGHHDQIPQRLRYNWNGEAAAKVKPAPPDLREAISPLPSPTAFSALPARSADRRDCDERIQASPADRSPILFRGPPAFLS